MEIAKYILKILTSSLKIFQSWGPHDFIALPNNSGLMFRVNGFKHKGWVKIIYKPGPDLFDILYCNNKMRMVGYDSGPDLQGVFFDEIVERIDRFVELTENYEETVKEWFTCESRVN